MFISNFKFLSWRMVCGVAVTMSSAMLNAEPIDFSRQILPILSENCFVCHGPDTRNEKDLRLDSREAATRDLGGYHALDPDHPEQSEILTRLRDKDDPMPPKDAEKQLTEAQKQLLEQWVKEGGAYDLHWAFKKPVKNQAWVDAQKVEYPNPIDAFIADGMREKDADFAPEADKSVLARRAALTLTGLPPELSDLSLHMADATEEAYGKWIDQLLKDPKYGEHQARYWLDAIRYGDTHGLHLDNRRGIYPFRDWVVRAFNDNMAFDQFITWQLAGDLLPDPTLEQQLATGFVRMNPTTSEGGVIPAEFQAKNNFDRVETFGTVFLGMTMVCSRCHTHKYDPITQKEYYELLAFFNSTSENPLDGNAYLYGPTLNVPENQPAWHEWLELSTRQDALLKGVDADTVTKSLGSLEKFGDWEAEEWKRSKSVSVDAVVPDDSAFEELKAEHKGYKKDRLGFVNEAVWVKFRLRSPVAQTLWVTFSGGTDSAVFLDGNPIASPTRQLPDQRFVSLPLVVNQGEQEVIVKMSGTEVQVAQEVRIETPWKSWSNKKDWAACGAADQLRMLADSKGPLAGMKGRMEAFELARRLALAEANFTTTLVAKDLKEPRETRLLNRGEYDQPTGDTLTPNVLSVMGTLPASAPKNRLGLAQWLTSRDHPVVARVLINQLWQRVFGVGLVRTPEDFGLQGQQPTHPELLDWLAVEFQDSGWDLQHMIRLMMASRTYRQDSSWRPDVSDPENRLFARGPSYRLDAEVIRDTGLWAADILDPHMGGEGVKPYQPSGMWMAMAHPASNTKLYERDRSHRAYRRSLYVYWKRTSPHPMMTLFDAPSREVSCVRRSRTNTSLQSLGLLNETQRTEMARMLAGRLITERFSDQERLDYLFGLLASRPANQAEHKACLDLLSNMRERYANDEESARSLISVGDLPSEYDLPAVEHAAWTQVATIVLASDSAIMLY